MRDIINYFVDQWQRSGNPAWLKIFMIALLITLLTYLVRSIKNDIRDADLQDELPGSIMRMEKENEL